MSKRYARQIALPDVARAVQDLARQIRLVHAVEVVQHEIADAARREIQRRGAAEPAESHDQHPRVAELRLAFGADLG